MLNLHVLKYPSMYDLRENTQLIHRTPFVFFPVTRFMIVFLYRSVLV